MYLSRSILQRYLLPLADQVEYAEAAIKWGTDYFLKAHSQSMTLYGQVNNSHII